MTKEIVEHIEMWTDGGIKKNPGGVMGCAYLLISIHNQKEYARVGGNFYTEDLTNTNNRSELLSFIHGLEAIKKMNGRLFVLTLTTDSYYLKRGVEAMFEETSPRVFEINEDLWLRIKKLVEEKTVYLNINLVKGHSGIRKNEIVDSIATYTMKMKNNIGTLGLYRDIARKWSD